MNQYQPYSWNNYNPYYQQQQMQMQPQVQQRFQQPMSPTQMSGRFVSDQSEITANDVPMTGSYALFPKNDMSEIYAKAWNSNGQIDTLVFKSEKLSSDSLKPLEKSSVDLQEVNERLDRIEKILANRSKARKEVQTDD